MAETTPLNELSAHLQKVDEEPTTQLDVDLIEKCELYTSTPEYRTSTWKETRPLFLQVAALLPKLQQDPAPLTHFVVKLAVPYRFEDIKDIDLEIALDLQAKPFHGLILSLLEKATASGIDAQGLANRSNVVEAIVRLWLCTEDTGIATHAAGLLTDLLRVSRNEPASVPAESHVHQYGSGPMWKRLFTDRDIYTLYFSYTTFSKLKTPSAPNLSKRDKTIAQARLLDWLTRVGEMDWETITSSQGAEVEKEVGLQKDQGLLQYASLKMVDTDDDMLMHMTLINFFSDLIATIKSAPHLTHYNSSPSLDFVKEEGIHKGIIDFHTSDSPGIEHSFLSSRTAHYISVYASTYPENFENSAELQTVWQYVHRNVRKCEANDLSIIAAMPRTTLVPRRPTGLAWDDCILLDIPITRTNPDALKTLATVFHGPATAEITFPEPELSVSSNTETEKAMARLLTSLYFTKHRNLFSDLISHAETIAMKDNALASLTLLGAIISSNWTTQLPANHGFESDPIYTRLDEFPATGLDLVLDTTLSGSVLPCLLRPATTFSNLVGGRGDAENAAYQVAMAKFDVLKVLGKRLEKESGRQDVIAMVRRRIAEGPWGEGGSAGSRIGTLEM